MGRAKKIDYAALFSYDEKRGLYYTTRSINGVKKKFRAKDPEQLQKRVEEALGEKPKVPTFREVAVAWWEQKLPTLQENTIIGYTPYYHKAIEQLGDSMITQIFPSDIERIILQMKDKGYSAKTVKAQKGVLKMIFDYAITREKAWITFNPATAVAIPRGLPKKKRCSPGDDVMQTIIDSVDTATFGLFPYLLLHTGCRRGEALALTWGDIDFQKNQIHITKEYTYPRGMPVLKVPKTEAGERTVFLLPGLAQKLIRPKDAKDGDLLFPSPDGRPMQENAFKRHWRHYCKDVGLLEDNPEERVAKNGRRYIYHKLTPTLTPHHLRHGYATLLYESGVDVKTAQGELGHKDIQTTMQTYTDLRESHRKIEVDKLSRYMKDKYGEVDTKSGH